MRSVLFERLTDDGRAMEGYTDNYIRVEVEVVDASLANRIVKVRLGETRWVDEGPVVRGVIEQ